MSSSAILTEDQLRAALLRGETGPLVAIVPKNLLFCEKCEQYFDATGGCLGDVLFDERNHIRLELIDWLVGDPAIKPSAINGRSIVDEIDRICPNE